MRYQIFIVVIFSLIFIATSCEHSIMFHNKCNEKVSVVIYSRKENKLDSLASDTIPASGYWDIPIAGSKRDYKELMRSIDSLVIVSHDLHNFSIPASDY